LLSNESPPSQYTKIDVGCGFAQDPTGEPLHGRRGWRGEGKRLERQKGKDGRNSEEVEKEGKGEGRANSACLLGDKRPAHFKQLTFSQTASTYIPVK